MADYQLQLKQAVDYPRCRIYRQFVQSLISDRSIRVSGGSGLFYFTVLCSYANFRTSYRRIDGYGYAVYPGEWICTIKELSQWFRTRFQWRALSILENLQQQNLITYSTMSRGKVVKYQITDWHIHNTVLDYNRPCQKDTGFFFMPLNTANAFLSSEHCSEMDIVPNLWLSTIYNDVQVEGPDIGPVVYICNGTGSPLVSYSELAERWNISKTSVCRILKKLEEKNYLSLVIFQGRTGTVIYLQHYLSTIIRLPG